MARDWTLHYEAEDLRAQSSGSAQYTQIPTTERGAIAFDPTTDELIIIEGVVPDELAGNTLKVRLLSCANTTSATLGVRVDIATEFRTPDAAEAMNVGNLDGTPDSTTLTFATTAYALMADEISLTPATTPVAGDAFRIQITRDANHATLDDLAVDWLLVAVEVFEEV